MSCDKYLFCTKKFWEALCHFMYTYGFELHHMTAQILYLYGFTAIPSVHKEITL